jgi:hypothetical protein
MAEALVHAETVELPSKGWFYPTGHPLSTGMIELKHLTAAHEDILTSRNLIQKGIVIDKLLEALIATPGVKYADLLIGDKNALMVAARIIGYGKDYGVSVNCPSCNKTNEEEIDLEQINEKPLDLDKFEKGKNEFLFELPISGDTITFKLFTQKDDDQVTREIEAMAKHSGKNANTTEITTRMRNAILSVNSNSSKEEVRKYVGTMLARDAKAWRDYAKSITPDIDFSFDFECEHCGHQERLEVPFTSNFFWPNS